MKSVIRNFYQLLWNRDTVDYVALEILEGNHEEQAVVEALAVDSRGRVIPDEELTAGTEVPLVVPNGKGQVFVLSPQATAWNRAVMQDKLARCLPERFSDVGQSYDYWLAAMDLLGAQQLTQTLGEVAADLATYLLLVDPQGESTVMAVRQT